MSASEQFLERTRNILARELNVDRARIVAGAKLREDLGMDSVIALNLIFAAERELEITIPEKDVVALDTVGDLEALLSRLSTAI
jgi:acyl carrier protein